MRSGSGALSTRGTNLSLVYTFSRHFSDFIHFLVFNPEKCGNICHYVSFSVSGFMLVNLLYATSPHKQVTDVSLVLKTRKPQFADPAFCIR